MEVSNIVGSFVKAEIRVNVQKVTNKARLPAIKSLTYLY